MGLESAPESRGKAREWALGGSWHAEEQRGPRARIPCGVLSAGGEATALSGLALGPGCTGRVARAPHEKKKTWPREARRGTGGELASPREHPALSQTRQGHSKRMQEASGIPGVGYNTGSRRHPLRTASSGLSLHVGTASRTGYSHRIHRSSQA